MAGISGDIAIPGYHKEAYASGQPGGGYIWVKDAPPTAPPSVEPYMITPAPLSDLAFNQAISGMPGVPFDPWVFQDEYDVQAQTSPYVMDDGTITIDGSVSNMGGASSSNRGTVDLQTLQSAALLPNGQIDWGRVLMAIGLVVTLVYVAREVFGKKRGA